MSSTIRSWSLKMVSAGGETTVQRSMAKETAFRTHTHSLNGWTVLVLSQMNQESLDNTLSYFRVMQLCVDCSSVLVPISLSLCGRLFECCVSIIFVQCVSSVLIYYEHARNNFVINNLCQNDLIVIVNCLYCGVIRGYTSRTPNKCAAQHRGTTNLLPVSR